MSEIGQILQVFNKVNSYATNAATTDGSGVEYQEQSEVYLHNTQVLKMALHGATNQMIINYLASRGADIFKTTEE